MWLKRYNTGNIAVAQSMSLLCESAAKRAKVHNGFRSWASELVESGGFPADMKEDDRKLCFCLRALDAQDPFELEAKIPDDVAAAFRWQADKTPEEVISEREYILSSLEAEGRSMWASGACQSWLESAEAALAAVSATVNGPILQDLCRAISYDDAECIDLFRVGADLYGRMPVSSIGPLEAEDDCVMSGCINELWHNRVDSNRKLLRSLKLDKFHNELHQLTLEDAAHGRVTYPREVTEQDLHDYRLCPRFGVEQGLKPDGSCKVRAVDHLSWSVAPDGQPSYFTKRQQKEHSVNGCTVVPVEIRHDHLDKLALVMKSYIGSLSVLPGLFKADVNAAFRRVPLRPDHRWCAAVVYWHEGKMMFAVHTASPFGSLSAVYNWERVGSLLSALIRRVLHIGVLRYVDDFAAPERPETLQHAELCVARLVRLVLGETAIEDRKLAHGMSLVWLGVQINISEQGFRLRPALEKAKKCADVIDLALEQDFLSAGCAEKLAGRLSWASQLLFHRLGRAMLRPIYVQKGTRDGSMNLALRTSLRWWAFVLTLDLCEEHPWVAPVSKVARLFVDARGYPPRCAAVLCVDGAWHYTDGMPSKRLLDRMIARKDNQIMALESIAIALGLSTFASELAGRKVVVYNDNKAAEAASRKGTARCWDHCEIVHDIWTHALLNRSFLWIERVSSKDNISDLPSREQYQLMESIGAVWRSPAISTIFMEDVF